MSGIFLKLLNLSISASWLVLVVLALRLVLKKAPKWVNVLLWGMVALRLLLPFSIESALSLIPSAETVSPEVVQFDPAPTITSGVEIIDNAVNPSLSESFAAAPGASVNPLYVWTGIAAVVWLIGLAAMLLYALVSYLRLRRRVRASIRLRENVYVCDDIASPFILGIAKPRIYLPSAMEEAQPRSVLLHEWAHLARHDHWWKPLGFALLAVYWFNPLLWLAYVLLCRDIELACDERVLRGMDAGQIRDYSSALLACSVPRRMIAACPLAFGEVGVKERVKNALRYKKPAFWVVAASVLVCAVVAVCFLTDPERATMKWAKELRVEDVTRIELTTMPQTPDKQYKDFDAEEFAEVVALINRSGGRYVRSMEPLAGSSIELYVTTTDGVRHTVVNNGNVYLCIDGDAYRNFYIAWPYAEGNAPVPEGFFTGDAQGSDEADRVYGAGWSILLCDGWEQSAEAYGWRSDKGDAYLTVSEWSSLAEELKSLRAMGHTVEELDGYYRCVTQEGLSNTIVYLYPAPSSESCCWVEIHWSYDNADESEVELQAKQLRMMAESFRVENGSSNSTVPPTEPEEGWIMPLVFIDSGNINNKTGLDTSKKLNKDNGKYVNLYVENKGSGSVIATINGQSKRTFEPGKSGHIYVEATQGPLGADRSYKFKIVPGTNGGTVDIYYEITQRDSVTGYPTAYDELLTNICNLRSAGARDIETDFSSDLLAVNDYYQSPGWLLRDLDGDGTSELLLGADWGDGHTVIFNIYRFDGAKAVRVVDGWSRSRWYLCTDGSLAHEGSDGASEGTFSYYRYENGTLRHLETLISLDGWFYSDTTDHYLGGDGFRAVSEEEADAVMGRYVYETLTFKPFEE